MTTQTQVFVNNFHTTVAATFGATDTTLQITDATGLPVLAAGEFYKLTLYRLSGIQESGWETVNVTARTGTQLTVDRSVEGAAASQFLVGDHISARLTAGTVNGLETKATVSALAGVVSGKADAVHSHTLAALAASGAGNKQVASYNSTSGAWEPRTVAELVDFTDVVDTTSPNNVVTVSGFVATGSATNIDYAIIPKGNGAIIANIPDNSLTGGNKRGTNAVDLQSKRDAAAKVASGNYSVISGGIANTASGAYSAVGGGTTNAVSGGFAALGGGASNTVQGSYAFLGGGQTNTANAQASVTVGGQSNANAGLYSSNLGGLSNTIQTGANYSGILGGINNLVNMNADHSFILGGNANQLDAPYSVAIGGFNGYDNGVPGTIVWGGYLDSGAPGKKQRQEYLMAYKTTSATPAKLATTGNVAVTKNGIMLPYWNMSFLMTGKIMAKNMGNDATAGWTFTAIAHRGSGSGTTVIDASSVTAVGNTSGFTLGAPTITADTVNDAVVITVTGLGSTAIQWIAYVDSIQVTL